MKPVTVILGVAAVVGGFILFKNIGKAQTAPIYAPAIAPGFQVPQYPNNYPQYTVPQAPSTATQTSGIAIGPTGVTYQDEHLKVEVPSNFLASIPLLGTLFGSTNVQKEGIAKVAP